MTALGPRFREHSAPANNIDPMLIGILNKVLPSGQRVLVGNVYATADNPIGLVERCWDIVNPGPPYLTGGYFTKVKADYPVLPDVQGNSIYQGLKYTGGNPEYDVLEYTGGFANPYFTGDLPTSEILNIGLDSANTNIFPNLAAFGPEVYNKLRPRLEGASLMVDIAEMRDIPRMLRTSSKIFADIYKNLGGSIYLGSVGRRLRLKTMAPKRVAGDFLNHQFGWIPFLKSFNDVYTTFNRAAAFKAQIKRDNGRWIRRVRTMQNVESEEVIFDSDINGGGAIRCHPQLTGVNNFGGRYQIIKRLKTEVWCEGVFKYYRPEFDESLKSYDSAWSAVNRELAIYGAQINPHHIWQATPWTWLIDWFSNAGDTIQRIQDWGTDTMVAKYMYLMNRQTRTLVARQTMNFYGGRSEIFEWERIISSKRRLNTSSPFGFSLSWGNLSPRQLAILAALGISRS